MDNTEKNDLYQIRQIIIELIEDRGFTVPDIVKNVQISEFRIMFDNSNINLFIKNGEKEVFVYFHIGNKNFGKNDLKTQVNKIFQEKENDQILILFVLKDKPNSSILKELKNPKYFNTEIFQRKELYFNITKHVLVPKHILLTEEETKEVLKKYNATKEQFPKIFKTDPVARYYGMKIGQVCKVIRNSKQTGQAIAYRTVE